VRNLQQEIERLKEETEIIRLKVRDLLTTRRCDALWVTRKGGTREIMAIHPEIAQRLRAYLAAGHPGPSSAKVRFAHLIPDFRFQIGSLTVYWPSMPAFGRIQGDHHLPEDDTPWARYAISLVTLVP
jgi:hypothetical protein